MEQTVLDSRHRADFSNSMGKVMIHTPQRCASKFRIIILASLRIKTLL